MMETFVSILYGVVGFFSAVAIGLLVGGYGLYLVRVGLEGRDEGIELMEWGVTTMFVVLLVALGIRFLS